MFIDENNLLYSFGRPEYGQLGHNTDGQYFVTANKLAFDCEVLPRHVAVFVEKTRDGLTHVLDDVKIVDVSCGNNHTVRYSLSVQSILFYASFTRIRIFLKLKICFSVKKTRPYLPYLNRLLPSTRKRYWKRRKYGSEPCRACAVWCMISSYWKTSIFVPPYENKWTLFRYSAS